MSVLQMSRTSLLAIVILTTCLGLSSALADSEPNNTISEAESIQPGTHGGTVGGTDGADYYAFGVTGGDIIRIAASASTAHDVRIQLRDHEETFLESVEPGETLVWVTAVELGERTWFVRATDEGAYQFALEIERQNDGGSGQDAPEAVHRAVEIGAGWQRGTLGDDDEKDCYRFSAAQGDVVTVEVQLDPSRFEEDVGPVEVWLLSPDRSGLEMVRSYGQVETLTYGPLEEDEAGGMTITVSGEGDYTLRVPSLGEAAPPTEAPPTEAPPTEGEPAPAEVGPPQTVEFGGEGPFRLMFPVRATGQLKAEVQWDPPVTAEVALYSPAQKEALANAEGAGMVGIDWIIDIPTIIDVPTIIDIPGIIDIPTVGGADSPEAERVPLTGPGAGGLAETRWMLEIIPRLGTVVRGRATVQWPGGDAGELEWQVPRPRTDLQRAVLASYIRAVQRVTKGESPANDLEREMLDRIAEDDQYADRLQALADSFEAMPQAQRLEMVGVSGASASLGPLEVSTALEAAGTTVSAAVAQARAVAGLEVGVPAAPSEVGIPPVPEETEAPEEAEVPEEELPPPILPVRFNTIVCYSEMDWDRGTDSDEIYFLIGLLCDGEARGARSRVFDDFDDGEQRPPYGMAAQEVMWEGEITGDTYFVVVMMENDDGSPSRSLSQFLAALEDAYAQYDISGLAELDAPWFLFLGEWMADIMTALFGSADDRIGRPQVLPTIITPEIARQWNLGTGPWRLFSENFRGGGANYGLMLTLGKEMQFGN